MDKCFSCSNYKVVYFQRFSGRFFCKKCYINYFHKKVYKYLRVNKLVKHKERVGVAVSGGKDSLALLNVLHNANVNLDLVVITVDEGIHGYRDRLIPTISKICDEFSVEHHVYSLHEEYGISTDDLAPLNLKYCTYCGVLRRVLLNKKARELGVTKLAIGHNLDDEIQTYFLNILRGDIDRFTRIGTLYPAKNSKFVPKIKPLRMFLEREVLIYSLLLGFTVQDSSCPYAYTAMRNDIRSFLDDIESKRPGTKKIALRSFDKLSKKLFPLMDSVEIATCTQCGEPSSNTICKACELTSNIKNMKSQKVSK